MKKNSRVIIITLVGFIAYYLLGHFLPWDWHKIPLPRLMGAVLYFMVITLPIYPATAIIHKKANFLEPLGLNGNIIKGLGFAFIFTLPLLIVYALKFPLRPELSARTLLVMAILPGIFEEIEFRGFLFGQLFRYAKVGFIPASLINALIFGSGHLYQSNDFGAALAIFSYTGLGGMAFAWLYVEWNYNLWIPVGFHVLMDGYWTIFSVGESAYSGPFLAILRVSVVALAIIFTIRYKLRKGIPFNVNRKTLFINQ